MSSSRTEIKSRIHLATGQTTRCLLVAAITIALSACGSGGGSDDNPTTITGANTPADTGTSTETDISTSPLTPNDADDVVDLGDPTQCNAATQKQWAFNALQDYYLFADQVPNTDPQVFDSASDVVRQLRFEERDPFSSVSNATSASLQFDAGLTFGVGYRWRYDDEGDARIIEVRPASPFGLAGVERGDIILTLDGLQWDDETLDATFGERVIGTPDNPATSDWQIRKRDTGEVVELEITSAQYRIDTVLRATTYTNPAFDGRTGYLFFSSFLNTSVQELEAAADFFQERQITELILDLRYNGGGRVFVAEILASLIVGSDLSGQLLYEYRYNDRYTDENYSLSFDDSVDQLGLSRVVILTTDNTASSSEIVIAGLQPYIDVVTIGEATSGKPYISSPNDRCDERLNLMEAEGFNAAGMSVFGGIQPICFAADDIQNDFGINPVTGEIEGFLLSALDYVVFGTCEIPPQTAAADGLTERSAARVNESSRQGMTQIEGAFTE